MGWHRDALTPLALSSVPGERPIEVLIGSATDEEQEALLSGDGPLWASDPQGRGFPMEKARGGPLLLFAGGSAIGAMRPVVESVLARREAFGPVTLYYGVRSQELVCFQERFQIWREHAIDVHIAVSREISHGGAPGYVQGALPDVIEDAERAIAFVCGRPEMEHDVTRALSERGVAADRVFRNW